MQQVVSQQARNSLDIDDFIELGSGLVSQNKDMSIMPNQKYLFPVKKHMGVYHGLPILLREN